MFELGGFWVELRLTQLPGSGLQGVCYGDESRCSIPDFHGWQEVGVIEVGRVMGLEIASGREGRAECHLGVAPGTGLLRSELLVIHVHVGLVICVRDNTYTRMYIVHVFTL